MTPTYPINENHARFAGGRTSKVRKATAEDVPGIVTIHQKAFGNFFLTQLGDRFLRGYYSLVLSYRAGIVLVSERWGALEGFACGFADPADFYELMWRNRRAFVMPVLSALVRHPLLAAQVLQGAQRIQSPPPDRPGRTCELSSIAVSPEAGGRGLGRTLIQAFLSEAWSLDAQCVHLTTDADGNHVANSLYRKAGFQYTRRFLQRKGRWMNEYVIERTSAADRRGARP